MEEILLINEKKESFFCASSTLFKKIQILEENFQEDFLFDTPSSKISEENYSNIVENFSYKNSIIAKNEKKLYLIVKIRD